MRRHGGLVASVTSRVGLNGNAGPFFSCLSCVIHPTLQSGEPLFVLLRGSPAIAICPWCFPDIDPNLAIFIGRSVYSWLI